MLSPSGKLFADSRCDRIVSLAPSVTETIYELGLGKQLVGRTRFCRYPPEAASVPSVGGFYDISVEAIVSLRPSYILTLAESRDTAEKAARFGGQVLVLDHTSVHGIKESIQQIASVCGIEATGAAKLKELGLRENAVRVKVAASEAPRTLVVVGRTQGPTEASAVYVSGSDGFYSEVLALAGARNVNERPTVALPLMSPEGLMVLKPDVVLEVVSVDDALDAQAARKLWARFPSVPAVQRGRVYVLSQDYASIPGPRYINLVEQVAQLLHPEVTKADG